MQRLPITTVVAARTRGEGEDGISLFLVKGRPKGMTVTALKTLDQTRRWSEVRFDGVKLEADSLMGAADQSVAAPEEGARMGDRGASAPRWSAARRKCSRDLHRLRQDSPAVRQADRHLSGRVAQAGRHARPIRSGRSATYYARMGSGRRRSRPLACGIMAKAYVSDAYRKVAGDGIRCTRHRLYLEHDMQPVLQASQIL